MTDSDATPSTPCQPTDAELDTFVQMSALLTGFAASAIAPSLDPVDLRRTLYCQALDGAGGSFTDLVSQYQQLAGGTDVSDMTPQQRQSIGDQLLGLGGDEQPQPLVETARSVMRLWYLGYWYAIDGSDPGGTVTSDQAYVRGLAWKSMQSHAMGYSTWAYGYWADEPPPLSDFTGRSEPAGTAAAAGTAAKAAPVITGPEAAGPVVPAEDAGDPVSATGQGKGGRSPAALAGAEGLVSEGGAR